MKTLLSTMWSTVRVTASTAPVDEFSLSIADEELLPCFPKSLIICLQKHHSLSNRGLVSIPQQNLQVVTYASLLFKPVALEL